MEELGFYPGTHSGGEIDRDLNIVDAAFNENFSNSDPSIATIPAFSRSKAPDCYKVSNYEFEFEAYPSYAIIPSNALITYGRTKSEVKKARVAKVVFSGISSLPQTITESVSGDASKMVLSENFEVIRFYLSNPSAQIGNWTVTTASTTQTIDGDTFTTTSVTISGSISGSTDVVLYLAEPVTII